MARPRPLQTSRTQSTTSSEMASSCARACCAGGGCEPRPAAGRGQAEACAVTLGRAVQPLRHVLLTCTAPASRPPGGSAEATNGSAIWSGNDTDPKFSLTTGEACSAASADCQPFRPVSLPLLFPLGTAACHAPQQAMGAHVLQAAAVTGGIGGTPCRPPHEAGQLISSHLHAGHPMPQQQALNKDNGTCPPDWTDRLTCTGSEAVATGNCTSSLFFENQCQ